MSEELLELHENDFELDEEEDEGRPVSAHTTSSHNPHSPHSAHSSHNALTQAAEDVRGLTAFNELIDNGRQSPANNHNSIHNNNSEKNSSASSPARPAPLKLPAESVREKQAATLRKTSSTASTVSTAATTSGKSVYDRLLGKTSNGERRASPPPASPSVSSSVRRSLASWFSRESPENREMRNALNAYKTRLNAELQLISKAISQQRQRLAETTTDWERQEKQLVAWGLKAALPKFHLQVWFRLARSRLQEDMAMELERLLKKRQRKTLLYLLQLDEQKKSRTDTSRSSALTLSNAQSQTQPITLTEVQEFCVTPQSLLLSDATLSALGERLKQLDVLCAVTTRQFIKLEPQFAWRDHKQRRKALLRILNSYNSLPKASDLKNIESDLSWSNFCRWYAIRLQKLKMIEQDFSDFIEDQREMEGRLFFRWYTSVMLNKDKEKAAGAAFSKDKEKGGNTAKDASDNGDQPRLSSLKVTPTSIKAFVRYFATDVVGVKYSIPKDCVNANIALTESLFYRRISWFIFRYVDSTHRERDEFWRAHCQVCRYVDPALYHVPSEYYRPPIVRRAEQLREKEREKQKERDRDGLKVKKREEKKKEEQQQTKDSFEEGTTSESVSESAVDRERERERVSALLSSAVESMERERESLQEQLKKSSSAAQLSLSQLSLHTLAHTQTHSEPPRTASSHNALTQHRAEDDEFFVGDLPEDTEEDAVLDTETNTDTQTPKSIDSHFFSDNQQKEKEKATVTVSSVDDHTHSCAVSNDKKSDVCESPKIERKTEEERDKTTKGAYSPPRSVREERSLSIVSSVSHSHTHSPTPSLLSNTQPHTQSCRCTYCTTFSLSLRLQRFHSFHSHADVRIMLGKDEGSLVDDAHPEKHAQARRESRSYTHTEAEVRSGEVCNSLFCEDGFDPLLPVNLMNVRKAAEMRNDTLLHFGVSYQRSARVLSWMNSAATPREMVLCLRLASVWILRDAIDVSGSHAVVGADLLVPLFTLVLVHAELPQLHLLLHVLLHYSDHDEQGDVSYQLANLEASLQFLLSLEVSETLQQRFARTSAGKSLSAALQRSGRGLGSENSSNSPSMSQSLPRPGDLSQDDVQAMQELGAWLRDQQTMEETIAILQSDGWML